MLFEDSYDYSILFYVISHCFQCCIICISHNVSVRRSGLGCGGKIGVCFRTSCENSGSFWFVCILHTDYILVSEMDGLMAPKPSITDS